MGRWYVGSPIPGNAAELLRIGSTGKAEVLARFGPPDRILRQRSGDVFIYRYDQRNSSELRIGTPPFIGIGAYTLFHWDKDQDKSDRLMVFFDPAGVVSAFGFRDGRAELEPF
jgi:hypothetical protein